MLVSLYTIVKLMSLASNSSTLAFIDVSNDNLVILVVFLISHLSVPTIFASSANWSGNIIQMDWLKRLVQFAFTYLLKRGIKSDIFKAV